MPDGIPVMPDHDILITLVETVKNNQTTVLNKIADVKDKVQEVNDGISNKVQDHERRLKDIEKMIDEIQPVKAYRSLQNLLIWQSQWDFKWKFVITLAFFIGGFLEWLVAQGITILIHVFMGH